VSNPGKSMNELRIRASILAHSRMWGAAAAAREWLKEAYRKSYTQSFTASRLQPVICSQSFAANGCMLGFDRQKQSNAGRGVLRPEA
jgi:hypothetical protein